MVIRLDPFHPSADFYTRRLSNLVVTLICFWLVPCALFAQDIDGKPFLRNYLPQEYKAASQTWAIVQDKRGVMYFGNREGILEYDGVSWRKIQTTNGTVVRSLAIDLKGTIFVGGVGEFGYLAPDSIGQLKFVSLLAGIKEEDRDFADVWKTHITDDGVIFQAYNEIFFLSASSHDIKTWKPRTSFHSSFFVHNRFYVNQRQLGLSTIDGDSLKLVRFGERFANLRIYAMLPFDEKTILVATREEGLLLLNEGGVKPFRTNADRLLEQSRVYCGTVLTSGKFAFGTIRGGLLVFDRDGSLARKIDKIDGLQNDAVLAVFLDSYEGLWLGLENGISRAEIFLPLTMFAENAGLKGTVLSIVRHAGRPYIGTSLGVYVMERTHPGTSIFKSVAGIKNQSWSFLSTGSSLLAGTSDGVYQIHEREAELIQKGSAAFTLTQSVLNPDIVYVGSSGGLAVVKKIEGRWTDLGKVSGINEDIRSIAETADGRLWLGTRFKGLLRINPSLNDLQIEHFGVEHGLPAGEILVSKIRGGEIFSGRGGLYRFDHGAFVADTAIQNHLPADSLRLINLLAEDAVGRVWMSSSFNGKYETMVALPQADGFYSIKRNPLTRLSDFLVATLYPDRDGIVWIGGSETLVRYDPQVDRTYLAPFSVLIRKAVVANDSIFFGGFNSPATKLTLPYRLNSLRLEYAAPFYDDETANQYQYRLGGLDEAWSPWSGQTAKEYSHLPPGSYTFRVRARNLYGTVTNEASFPFSVQPPWFLTWWALLIYAGSLVFFLALIVKIRSRSLEQEKRRLEKLVEERTDKILRQNEELQMLNDKQNEFMSIVAHDLRSPLSGIIGLQGMMYEDIDANSVDMEVWKKNLKDMNLVATRMTVLINDLLDISAIEAGKLTLQLAEENLNSIVDEGSRIHKWAASQKQIELAIETKRDLPMVIVDKRRIAEVLDNLLSNAIKYTFTGGRVRLFYEVLPTEVAVHIEDSGQGLTEKDLSELFTGFKKLSSRPTGGESSTGLGLVIAKKIIEQHGGKIGVKSVHGKGTIFTFSLPRKDVIVQKKSP